MWNVLGSLVSSFLLTRDLFGYAIPGAVMLAIVDYLEHPDLSKLPIANEPPWLQAVAAVTASYAVGRVLAAIGYTLLEFPSVPSVLDCITKCITTKHTRLQIPRSPAMKEDERVERDVKASHFRYLYPFMFNECDRRETLAILHVVLSVGLVLAVWLPHATTSYQVAFLTIGLFMFWNGHWLRGDAENCRDSALRAAEEARRDHVPFFDWSGPKT